MRDYDLMIDVGRIVYALPLRDVRVEWGEHPETREIGVVVRAPKHWGHNALTESALRRGGYDVQVRTAPGGETAMWIRRSTAPDADSAS